MKITNQKGFSLLEITLVLGIGTAMAFMKFQDMKKDQENIIANTVGAQMKQMGEVVNRYISIRLLKQGSASLACCIQMRSLAHRAQPPPISI